MLHVASMKLVCARIKRVMPGDGSLRLQECVDAESSHFLLVHKWLSYNDITRCSSLVFSEWERAAADDHRRHKKKKKTVFRGLEA